MDRYNKIIQNARYIHRVYRCSKSKKMFCIYRNLKLKLLKSNAAIWYNILLIHIVHLLDKYNKKPKC